MAQSLAKIHEQIARLQKQAASIQSTVIARIRREIAQHGLTAEHLFGAGGGGSVGNGRRSKSGGPASAKAEKPAKFADSNGNTWHGIGKRPTWIHQALAAGKSLDDFLVGKAATPSSARKAKKAGDDRPVSLNGRKNAATAKKTAKAAAVSRPSRHSPGKGLQLLRLQRAKRARPSRLPQRRPRPSVRANPQSPQRRSTALSCSQEPKLVVNEGAAAGCGHRGQSVAAAKGQLRTYHGQAALGRWRRIRPTEFTAQASKLRNGRRLDGRNGDKLEHQHQSVARLIQWGLSMLSVRWSMMACHFCRHLIAR